MPVFRSGAGRSPAWCEVEFFEIIRLDGTAGHIFQPSGTRQKLFAVSGSCQLRIGEQLRELQEGEERDVPASAGAVVVERAVPATVLVRLCGRWGEQTAGCGVFTMDRSKMPRNAGDPTTYPRTTDFDNHYHDCDEYWVITEGRCMAVSEGKCYVLHAGECLVTGKGHHHDIIDVLEPLRGIWFESTLEGARRTGHLWDHTHGVGVPDPRRV